MAAAPDLTIIYSGDAVDWDKYLAECFAQVTDPEPMHINHERLDGLSFPLSSDQSQTLTSSKCVLVIISPEFLDFVNEHADVFELGKLLRPHQTVAILCGVQEMDVDRFQKAALVSYDSWSRLVAQDQDENFVLAVIRVTREILTRMDDGHTVQKPHFQLSPRKVKEGNNKVFIMMKKQMNEKQKIQVFLDVDGGREVVVKRRNAYTFQFFVPDHYLRYSRMMKVHLRCDDCFLGVREIKVESRMGELYSILSSVNSPYELLCETLGVASYYEVDENLAKNFVQNSTEGLGLLAGNCCVDKKKSEEELPTLMHFAARYGLPKLMKAILQYPMAMPASRMRNVRGLTPAQLANSSGHNGIALLLEEFQKTLDAVKETGRLNENCSLLEQKPLSKQHSPFEYQNISYCNKTYNVPLNTVVPTSTSVGDEPTSPDYLPMSGSNTLYADKLEPHQLILLGLDEQLRENDLNSQFFGSESVEAMDRNTTTLEAPPSRHYPSGLCPSQKELLDIMAKYKKGTPLTDVEKQFNIWQTKHKEKSNQNALTSLRDAYKMIQKQQKTHKKQAFGLSDLKHALFKLGKKDGQTSSASTLERKPRDRVLSRSEDSPMGLDGFRPVSTLSTASTNSSSSSSSFDRFSAISAGSLYDSGNHSDSCDETARLQESKPKVETSHSPIGPKISLSLRPPAPPPRPPKFLPKSAKKNKEKQADSLESRNYYNQRAIREYSPDYIVPNSDTYVFPSDVEKTVNALAGSSNGINPAERKHSLRSKGLVKGRTCKSVTDTGDEIYYDIPAPPLPVRRNQNDSGLTALVDPGQDYHFPKSPIRRVSGVPGGETALSNYSVPRFSHHISNERYPGTPPRPAMPRPVLSTINIPLEVNVLAKNLGNSPIEEKCDSIPSEPPPPPPMESDYDILPFPRKYTPNV